MIQVEDDEGFASCEENDIQELEKKRTGDPLMDF